MNRLSDPSPNPAARGDSSPTGVVACAVCGNGLVRPVLTIPTLPVNCVSLWKSHADAMSCARGRIELVLCDRCEGVSNVAFDDAQLTYDSQYDNSLHFSPAFVAYTEALARDLIAHNDLRGKTVIDIGCGNGEFLSLLCALGNNRGIGFDPSFIPGRADMAAGQGIEIVRDYYSEQYAGRAADLIVCRQVLEHIVEPQRFSKQLRATIGERVGAGVFIEVPNARFVFSPEGMWDIIYEHCIYYTAASLATLLSDSGFDVVRINETFNGQYLAVEAKAAAAPVGRIDVQTRKPGTDGASIAAFGEVYERRRADWTAMLQEFRDGQRRVVLWGAGAKGAMFLNALSAVLRIDYIVDINPHKLGLHIPGTGQEVVGPDFLVSYRPDVVLVMNVNYVGEIKQKLGELGLTPQLISI